MSLLLLQAGPCQGVVQKDDSAVDPAIQYKHKEVNRWDVMAQHLWPRSGFVGSLDGAGQFNLYYSDEDAWKYPEYDDYKGGSRYSVLYKIQGITEDSGGNPLGGCVVKLFRTLDDSKQDQCVSDTVGNYLLMTPFPDAHYCVMFLDPSLAGATVRNLMPV
jgi:hypothetical protein